MTGRNRHFPAARSGHGRWSVLVFLSSALIFLVVLGTFYLLPAFKAARDAVPHDREQLAAWSLLLLVVILVMLFIGLMLTFHVRRFFFPRSMGQPTHTPYVDAWKESARRMRTPPP